MAHNAKRMEVKRGRPRVGRPGAVPAKRYGSPILPQVRVPPDMHAEIMAAVAATGRGYADVARGVWQAWLEGRGASADRADAAD